MTELKTKFNVGDRVYSKTQGESLLKLGTVTQVELCEDEWIAYEIDWDQKPNPNHAMKSAKYLGHVGEILELIWPTIKKVVNET